MSRFLVVVVLSDWHLAVIQVSTAQLEDSTLCSCHILITTVLRVRRPIAGNINLCPGKLKNVKPTHDENGNLKLKNWKAAITHELMHVMVSECACSTGN